MQRPWWNIGALDLVNFFLADVRGAFGPYLGVFLVTQQHWNQAAVGLIATVGGLAGLAAHAPWGALIDAARKDGDSLGGVVEAVARNVPVGLGEPVFDKLEADLAKAMLSLPACKGFESGSGFEDEGDRKRIIELQVGALPFLRRTYIGVKNVGEEPAHPHRTFRRAAKTSYENLQQVRCRCAAACS